VSTIVNPLPLVRLDPCQWKESERAAVGRGEGKRKEGTCLEVVSVFNWREEAKFPGKKRENHQEGMGDLYQKTKLKLVW